MRFITSHIRWVFPHLVVAELMFVLLPIIILVIYHTCQMLESNLMASKTFEVLIFLKMIFSLHEIAFAASVLFGLATTKCVIVAHLAGKEKWPGAVASAAFMMVLGLAPSLTILLLGLSSDETHMRIWLTIAQVIWLVCGIMGFLAIGMREKTLEVQNQANTSLPPTH